VPGIKPHTGTSQGWIDDGCQWRSRCPGQDSGQYEPGFLESVDQGGVDAGRMSGRGCPAEPSELATSTGRARAGIRNTTYSDGIGLWYSNTLPEAPCTLSCNHPSSRSRTNTIFCFLFPHNHSYLFARLCVDLTPAMATLTEPINVMPPLRDISPDSPTTSPPSPPSPGGTWSSGEATPVTSPPSSRGESPEPTGKPGQLDEVPRHSRSEATRIVTLPAGPAVRNICFVGAGFVGTPRLPYPISTSLISIYAQQYVLVLKLVQEVPRQP
jgi:hypothetical protein